LKDPTFPNVVKKHISFARNPQIVVEQIAGVSAGAVGETDLIWSEATHIPLLIRNAAAFTVSFEELKGMQWYQTTKKIVRHMTFMREDVKPNATNGILVSHSKVMKIIA
jgi:hypothetical protein